MYKYIMKFLGLFIEYAPDLIELYLDKKKQEADPFKMARVAVKTTRNLAENKDNTLSHDDVDKLTDVISDVTNSNLKKGILKVLR